MFSSNYVFHFHDLIVATPTTSTILSQLMRTQPHNKTPPILLSNPLQQDVDGN